MLDRKTGKPLFPVDEKPVADRRGRAKVAAVKDAALFGLRLVTKASLTEADMWGMTPARSALVPGRSSSTPTTRANTRRQASTANSSSIRATTAARTGAASLSIQKDGVLVANYNNMANYTELHHPKAKPTGCTSCRSMSLTQRPRVANSEPQAGAPYAVRVNPGWREWTGLMCKQPPYGGIRAIDLKTGKTIWDEPLGLATREWSVRHSAETSDPNRHAEQRRTRW